MKNVLLMMAGACVFAAGAAVTPASIFGDGMVLQRDKPVRVWGKAAAGEAVTVAFAGRTAQTQAAADGAWRVELPAFAASKEGRTLEIKGATNAVSFKDILVGEVWFVCGQSNTECPLWGNNPHFRDAFGASTAMMQKKRCVRFARTSNYRWSTTPKTAFDQKVEWKEFTRENLMQGSSFSAMGAYYALELYSALDIPVAVIGSYWGGTRIEPWTPRCGFESVPTCKTEAAHQPNRQDRRGHQQPMVLWNEQVAPWTPFQIRGFIWYQGCSNAGEYGHYCDLMHALYNGWAKAFANPDLKLYFVQLAPWGFGDIAKIQEAQAKFAAEEKNAGMAVINDWGNLADIHPNNKLVVGKRLALHALKKDYGFADIVADSPTLKTWKIEGDRFVLSFNDANGWSLYDPNWTPDNGFEIAGADGKWVKAQIVNLSVDRRSNRSGGVINGRDLIVSAPGVAAPKKLRYLYSRPWFGAVYSDAGLPLGAFHIGD